MRRYGFESNKMVFFFVQPVLFGGGVRSELGVLRQL